MGRHSRFVRMLLVLAGCAGAVPQGAWAHDPRTTARTLSQGLEIEGVGRLALDYKGLHFNEENYARARSNPGFLGLLNSQIWGRMGHATLGFEVAAHGLTLAPGDYDFGINLTPAEEFSLVFWQGEIRTELPLTVEREQKPVAYLTIALQATEAPDSFLLEARCGPYRGTLVLKVPAVTTDHAHTP